MSEAQKSNSDVAEKKLKDNTGQQNKTTSDNKKSNSEENKTNNVFVRRRVWPD